VRKAAGTRRLAGTAASVPCGIGATATEERVFPRDEGAADAAATMAGTEQGGKADKHGDLHVGFECPSRTRRDRTDRCALVTFKSNFRSVAFHNKTRDQADFLSFSVKRPFQNEISLTPPNQDLRGLSAAYAGLSVCSP
jgi:hypothetical protein